MDANAVWALIGASLLAFAVRAFNTILEWLARILKVEPAEPIPTRQSTSGSASGSSTTTEPPSAGSASGSSSSDV